MWTTNSTLESTTQSRGGASAIRFLGLVFALSVWNYSIFSQEETGPQSKPQIKSRATSKLDSQEKSEQSVGRKSRRKRKAGAAQVRNRSVKRLGRSAIFNKRDFYIGLGPAVTTTEMDRMAETVPSANFDIARSNEMEVYGGSLVLGTEFLDDSLFSLGLEGGIAYMSGSSNDYGEVTVYNNVSFKNYKQEVIMKTATLDALLYLNLRIPEFMISPFLGVGMGKTLRDDRLSFETEGSSVSNFTAEADSELTESRLIVGLRVINDLSYFSTLKFTTGIISQDDQENSRTTGANAPVQDFDQYYDGENFWTLGLTIGSYF